MCSCQSCIFNFPPGGPLHCCANPSHILFHLPLHASAHHLPEKILTAEEINHTVLVVDEVVDDAKSPSEVALQCVQPLRGCTIRAEESNCGICVTFVKIYRS